jgi:hypothetical protein
MSYNDWACLPMPKAITSANFANTDSTSQVYGTGSILAIDPIDLGLDSIDAPGKLQQTSVYCSFVGRNLANADQEMEMYVVAVSQGIFTLFNGQASSLIGILNSNDILNAHEQYSGEMLSYDDARDMYGGNFYSDIKSDLRNLKKKMVPKQTGMGKGSGVSGGARVGRRNLKERFDF